MNRSLKIIHIVLLALLPLVQAQDFKDIPPPPMPKSSPGKESPFPSILKEKLAAGDLPGFYNEAKVFSKKLNPLKPRDYTDETLHERLWCIYYVVTAPMMDDKKYRDVNDGLDYRTKQDYVNAILKLRKLDLLSRNTSFSQRELTKLLAAYFAASMRGFNEHYDPDFPEKDEQIIAEAKQNGTYDRLFRNERIFLEIRNTSAGSNLRWAEPLFVEWLVAHFPGKAAEVKRYIRMAGYPDEEIPVLLDLTVGRNEQTEFLYKGRPKNDPPKTRKKVIPADWIQQKRDSNQEA